MPQLVDRSLLNLFLGIDISKEKFDACCIASNGDKVFRMSAAMSRDGFEEPLMQVSSIAKNKESILIGGKSGKKCQGNALPLSYEPSTEDKTTFYYPLLLTLWLLAITY